MRFFYRFFGVVSLSLFFLFTSIQSSLAFSVFGDDSEKTGVLKTVSILDEKKTLLLEKENNLKVLEEKKFIEQELLQKLEVVREKKSEQKSEENEEKISTQEYENKKSRLEASLTEKKITAENNLIAIKEEIQELSQSIELLEIQYQKTLRQTGIRIGIFILIFFTLFFSQSYLNTFIENLGEKYEMSDSRIIRLKNIKKWIFNVFYLILFLVFFSVQILAILPFLAILGTAVAFALRDIISSFIAWFVIGTKNGYKVGHVITVGDAAFGRVVEISSFVTQIQEMGMNGSTGKYVTFPNKKIFEGNIHNWWRRKGFIYESLDFFLTQDSNPEKARKILEEVMIEANEENMMLTKKETKALKILGVRSESMEPRTFLDIRYQGLFIRGKLLTHFDERNDTRTTISQLFIERIQKEDDITILCIDDV